MCPRLSPLSDLDVNENGFKGFDLLTKSHCHPASPPLPPICKIPAAIKEPVAAAE